MPDQSEDKPFYGVGVLVWKGEQLLLGKRIDKDADIAAADSRWQFPGGHLEEGESVTQCAVREVSEETGLKVMSPGQIAVTDRAFTVGYKHYITFFVSCEYASGDARVLEPDKCECWRWFDHDELPQPLFEPIEILLSRHEDLLALKHAYIPSASSEGLK